MNRPQGYCFQKIRLRSLPETQGTYRELKTIEGKHPQSDVTSNENWQENFSKTDCRHFAFIGCKMLS